MKKLIITSILLIGWMTSAIGQESLSPDHISKAWKVLETHRSLALEKAENGGSLLEIVSLGVWDDRLDEALTNASLLDSLEAEISKAYMQAEFGQAEWLLNSYSTEVSDLFALRYSILLAMQRWDLEKASTLLSTAKGTSLDPAWLAYQEGKLLLWDKSYEAVLALAEDLANQYPDHHLPYLLKAEAAFWLLDLETAESALQECLTIHPFDPDARFWYGYVIWRKRDAALLDLMAAHWEIALATHPYHYLTHWHWGNGHTNQTYSDYYDPYEDSIRAILDESIGTSLTPQNFLLADSLSRQFPESAVPLMYLGSAYFQLHDNVKEHVGLEPSPISYFEKIFDIKPHYGPAHNGIATVLKDKQMRYLSAYDSLEQLVLATEVDQEGSFYRVFPDVNRYPGSRVPKMVYSQLHSATAYLEMLDTLRREFAIPPLHEDLAIAMDNLWFRGGTTFDNRQWMDIRGVGSGATGIEYVERGAHLERNVTLHEYVHLFHGTVLTDSEQRRIRELYQQAMANNYTLDYYARNNEYEYFAQGFPAYFSSQKVHPLNHKSVNTREDLIQKDPDLFAFIDSMVTRQRAYLEGDATALSANWAQAYLRLTEQALVRDEVESANRYLQQAYEADSGYLPVLLTQVKVAEQEGFWDQASDALTEAGNRFPSSSRVKMANARHMMVRFRNGMTTSREAVAAYLKNFRSAQQLESDALLKAEWQSEFRITMTRMARWDLLMTETQSYVALTDTTSTYLRHLKDDGLADIAWVKGMMGYGEESDSLFSELIRRRPQAAGLRAQHAEVLVKWGNLGEAEETLKGIREIYEAAGTPVAWLDYLWSMATQDEEIVETYLKKPMIPGIKQGYWMGAQYIFQDSLQIANWQEQLRPAIYPQDQAERYFSEAIRAGIDSDWDAYIGSLQEALNANPFDLDIRSMLIDFLMDNEQQAEAMKLAREGQLLPIPPGPDAPEWSRIEFSDEGEE